MHHSFLGWVLTIFGDFETCQVLDHDKALSSGWDTLSFWLGWTFTLSLPLVWKNVCCLTYTYHYYLFNLYAMTGYPKSKLRPNGYIREECHTRGGEFVRKGDYEQRLAHVGAVLSFSYKGYVYEIFFCITLNAGGLYKKWPFLKRKKCTHVMSISTNDSCACALRTVVLCFLHIKFTLLPCVVHIPFLLFYK